jgi:hypothetical protein
MLGNRGGVVVVGELTAKGSAVQRDQLLCGVFGLARSADLRG